MCGIVGIVHLHSEQPVVAPLLRSMCHTLRHRGPDDEGIYVDGPVGLGMRRLSIIDISSGHQPLSNERGTIWVVFNGEIYNFPALRAQLEACGHCFATNTDTEVIVHAYEEYGVGCVERLWGMFAFAVWDATRRQLLIARDRLGKKPLYYYRDDERFIIASEIKAILSCPDVKRDIDLVALDDYLHYGFIPGPHSIYQHIRKLPQAHWAALQLDGEFTMQQYWEFPRPQVGIRRSVGGYLNELGSLLEDAVRIRLISDVPLGAFLSGGIDSGVVVEAMSRYMTQPVKTFTIGFTEESYNEASYARQVAILLETEHRERQVSYELSDTLQRIVQQFDEPFADASAIPTYYLAQFTRQGVTVALAGDGGDEVFGGYSRYVGRRWAQVYLKVPAVLRRGVERIVEQMPSGTAYHGESLVKQVKWLLRTASRAERRPLDITVSVFPDEARRRLLRPDIQASLVQIDSSEAHSFVEQVAASYTELDQISQMMWTDAHTYLADDILVKADRMSMAHSLEVRSPLLDHRLIEFMAQVPVNLKVRGLETKYLLKRYAESRLPRSIVHRKKHGFSVPLGDWFLGPLRPLVEDLLLGTQSSSLLDHSSVAELVQQHWTGKADHGQQIWSLLVLRLWEQNGTT